MVESIVNENVYQVNRIRIIQGDITRLESEAIVNAANNSLLGGGGVDGAIHGAAGQELLEECRKVGHCPTGEARVTRGYQLPAKYVIHTVGPIWSGGKNGESDLLRNCYRSCFQVASSHGITTIGFPSISTGVYGYPLDLAVPLALKEISSQLENFSDIQTVFIVCFDNIVFNTYTEQKSILKL